MDLSFLDNKGQKYEATLYADAEDADWKKNPEAYKITQSVVDNKSQLSLKLVKGGGAAVAIKQIHGSKLAVTSK